MSNLDYFVDAGATYEVLIKTSNCAGDTIVTTSVDIPALTTPTAGSAKITYYMVPVDSACSYDVYAQWERFNYATSHKYCWQTASGDCDIQTEREVLFPILEGNVKKQGAKFFLF